MITLINDTPHSKFSASGSKRWLSCPASIKLSEGVKGSSSYASFQGTVAHHLAELKLNEDLSSYLGQTFTDGTFQVVVDEEMEVNVKKYINYISKLSKETNSSVIEKTVTYESVVEGGFGTLDYACWDKDTCHVIDFKYGKWSVEAYKNTQAMLYSVGLLQSIPDSVDKFVIHIVQPRIDNYSKATISKAKILEFRDFAKKKANLALSDKPTFNAGNHCRFCLGKYKCNANLY